MNILVLEDSSKVGMGGGQQITLNVISTLLAKRATVNLTDYTNSSIFYSQIKKLNNINCFIIKNIIKTSYTVGSKSSGPLLSVLSDCFSKTLSFFVFSLCRINFLRSNDIFYCTTRNNIINLFILKMFFSKKTFYIHLHSYQDDTLLKYLFYKLLIFFSIQIVVPSSFMKSDLKKYGLHSLILYNCLNNNTPILENNGNKEIDIAFTGGEYIWKGYSFFKRLSQSLFLDNQNIKINAFSRKWNNSKNYKSFKKVSCDNLIHELCDVKICIFPSLSPESFCIAALEARAAGCYVIYRDIGALSEIFLDYENSLSLSSLKIDIWQNSILNVINNLRGENTVKIPTRYLLSNFEDTIINIFYKNENN